MRPRTAIARGAVIKGFIDKLKTESEATTGDDTGIEAVEHSARALVLYDKINTPQVTSTVARFNIGTDFLGEYDEDIHLAKDKIWHEGYGKWMAENQMIWFLKRVCHVKARF
jgi:hypothetical protein